MHPLIDIGTKNVLIIGKPASGKTFLTKQLAHDNPGHHVLHTDDYISYGYKEALYAILLNLDSVHKPTIIEGVLGYRMLRKGVELDCYYPNIVIELDITDALMYQCYRRERPKKDIAYLKGFNATHEKILRDYKAMENPHPPEWHKIQNSY